MDSLYDSKQEINYTEFLLSLKKDSIRYSLVSLFAAEYVKHDSITKLIFHDGVNINDFRRICEKLNTEKESVIVGFTIRFMHIYLPNGGVISHSFE